MRVAVVMAAVGFASLLFAEEQPPKSDPPGKPAAKSQAKKAVFTPERESVAIAFAKSNHPELAELLGNLQTMNRGQYETAVAVLATQAENLAAILRRDADMHALALKEWKAQSRVNVLAARITHMDGSSREAAEGELRTLLGEQSDLKISRKELEVKRTAEQLKKAEDQLQKLKSDRDSWIAQQVKRWMKSKEKSKPKSKTAEPSSKKPEPKP